MQKLYTLWYSIQSYTHRGKGCNRATNYIYSDNMPFHVSLVPPSGWEREGSGEYFNISVDPQHFNFANSVTVPNFNISVFYRLCKRQQQKNNDIIAKNFQL